MKTSGMSVSNRLTAALLAIALVGPLSCSNQGKNTKWSSRDQSIVPTTNQPANLGTVADSGPRLKVQNPNLKAAAIEVLEQGSVSERSLMRANAIEALEADDRAAEKRPCFVDWSTPTREFVSSRRCRSVDATSVASPIFWVLCCRIPRTPFEQLPSIRCRCVVTRLI